MSIKIQNETLYGKSCGLGLLSGPTLNNVKLREFMKFVKN